MEALREFDWAPHSDPSRLRSFLANNRLTRLGLPDLRDRDVVAFVRASIQRGDALVLRHGSSPAAAPSATLELRRLVAKIERQFRGKLAYRGRQYKLAPGENLAKVPGRDGYEVVSQTEAAAVLDGIARDTGAPAQPLLAQAREKLSRDWRPPFSDPDGLVLLRRLPVQVAKPREDGPAITPSEMRALVDKATLEIHVVDLNRVPQEDLAYTIGMPDGGSVQGKLDENGCATAKSSQPGIFTVRFPDLDGADWDGDGALELPPEDKRSRTSEHEVQQGDRLPTIARKQGFLRWQTVWDFGDNVDLRKLRSSPFVLFPGDKVVIPSKLDRVAEVDGGKSEDVVQSTPEVLRVRFAEVEAMAATVLFRATPDAGDDAFEGELTEDGTMEVPLPPYTTKVVVELFCGDGDDPFVTYEFAVGELDPASQPTGVQMRLANLGYYSGKIDGDVGELTKAAIVRFRREYGLPASDVIDDELRDALRWVHDDDDDTDDCDADQTIPDDLGEDKVTDDMEGADEDDDANGDADDDDGDADDDSNQDLDAEDDGAGEDEEDGDYQPVEWEDDSGDEDEDDDAQEVTSWA